MRATVVGGKLSLFVGDNPSGTSGDIFQNVGTIPWNANTALFGVTNQNVVSSNTVCTGGQVDIIPVCGNITITSATPASSNGVTANLTNAGGNITINFTMVGSKWYAAKTHFVTGRAIIPYFGDDGIDTTPSISNHPSPKSNSLITFTSATTGTTTTATITATVAANTSGNAVYMGIQINDVSYLIMQSP